MINATGSLNLVQRFPGCCVEGLKAPVCPGKFLEPTIL